jgi:hypothetical protein
MSVYRVKFEGNDFRSHYFIDVDVLGRNKGQAVKMACERVDELGYCRHRIDNVKEIKKQWFFSKPKFSM